LIPSLRQQFNQIWSPDKYARFLQLIQERTGEPPRFRHSETPCFFPAALIAKMAAYGHQMVHTLLDDASYAQASAEIIPERYRVPNEPPYPLFVQADFGLDQDLEPKLVEIQGFASLYAYQPVLSESYRDAYGLAPELGVLPGGLTHLEYWPILREAIVSSHDPDEVVLLEIDPDGQKTRCDFVVTEQRLGVRAVDIRSVKKQGNRLFYERDGRLTPIRRIYNRTIVDELERRGTDIPFNWTDELDVEWAGHPNWFFRLSKFSLPYLRHPAVPRSTFLHRADDFEGKVLKPLFSFAGAGVAVNPRPADIDSIPPEQRHLWILQDRVDFRPVVATPYGAAKVEVRIMYVWLDELRAVNTIIRMGRGAQMGVDHNKGLEWVGASAAFIPEGL
jgi:hypothetical protein